MKKRIFIFAMAFALLFSLFPNLPATAADYRSISFGTTYSGNITPNNTSDRYTVALAQAGRLTVNVTRDGSAYQVSDLIVRWIDSSGREMRGGGIVFPHSAYMDLEAGTYHIEVAQSWGSTGTYSLWADFAAAGNDDIRPNNTRPSAHQLASGQTVKGFISHQCTNAFYECAMPQAGRLTINVTGDGSAYQVSDLIVRWSDSKGKVLKDGGIEFPHSAYMDLEAGSYYIEIAQRWGGTGTYCLSVQGGASSNASEWTLGPSSIAFASAPLGYGTQSSQGATITNTGKTALTSVSASITSGGSSFEIVAAPPNSIASGGATTVSVRPKMGLAAGSYAGTLTVSTASGSKTVALSFAVGSVANSGVTLTRNSPSATVTIPFGGRVAVTVSGGAATVKSSNSGSDDPALFDAASGGTKVADDEDGANWVYLFSSGQTLYAGYFGDVNSGSYIVTASFGDETDTWTLNPSSMAFASAPLGYGTQNSQTATITNTGTAALTSMSASITSGSSSFEIVSAPPNSISAGGATTVGVRPKTGLAAGSYAGTLTVSTSGGSKTVALSFTVGSAVGSGVTLTKNSPSATVTIPHGGRVAVTVSGGAATVKSSTASLGDPALYDAASGGTKVADDEDGANWVYRFSSGQTLYAGYYNDASSGSYIVTAAFEDEIPVWTLTPASVAFASADVGYGMQGSQTATITNTGTTALTSVSAIITSGSSSFEIVAAPPNSISAGGKSMVGVRPKTGLAAGNYAGTLTVYAAGGSKTVSLSFAVKAVVEEKPVPSNPYRDIYTSDWYYSAVMFVHERGLMIGMDTGLFAPDEILTREQAITIIARLSGDDYLAYSGQTSFADIAPDRWSGPAIAWARSTGVTNGVGDNRFDPESDVTLDQFEVMLMRHFGVREHWKGNSTSCSRANAADLLHTYVSQHD